MDLEHVFSPDPRNKRFTTILIPAPLAIMFIWTTIYAPVYGLAIGTVAAIPVTYLMTCVLLELNDRGINDGRDFIVAAFLGPLAALVLLFGPVIIEAAIVGLLM
jgi:hypothetical protein